MGCSSSTTKNNARQGVGIVTISIEHLVTEPHLARVVITNRTDGQIEVQYRAQATPNVVAKRLTLNPRSLSAVAVARRERFSVTIIIGADEYTYAIADGCDTYHIYGPNQVLHVAETTSLETLCQHCQATKNKYE